MAKEEQKARMPHFSNLNEDPALTNKLVHMIKPGLVPFLINIFDTQAVIDFKMNSIRHQYFIQLFIYISEEI